jgi:hypothetical protein
MHTFVDLHAYTILFMRSAYAEKGARTLSIKTFSIMTLTIKGLYVTLRKSDILHNNDLFLCWVSLCWVSHFIYHHDMMNVVMLIVVMLSVMVPRKGLSKRISKEFFLIFEIFDADLVQYYPCWKDKFGILGHQTYKS